MSSGSQGPQRSVVSKERGFLPERDPLQSFDTGERGATEAAFLRRLDGLAKELPELLECSELRPAVKSLGRMPEGLVDTLTTRERWRLCLLSGFLASAYVHDIGNQPVDSLPAGVARPLYECSRRLERKPMLAYDLLCLQNFRRRDSDRGLELDNIDTLVDFTTHDDERWFVKIHVAIEAAAGTGLAACRRLHESVQADRPAAVKAALEAIQHSVENQTEQMQRMNEHNDPETFATEYRPYYDGFDGVVYQGVDAFDGEPQSFRGGSGAQSMALPSFDAALGIDHSGTGLTSHLDTLRSHMPAPHLAVVDEFDSGPDVRSYVATSGREDLRSAYNGCIDAVCSFRTVHFGQTIAYIRRMTGDTSGTGGTDYASFLRKLQSKTKEHRL